MLKLTQRSRHFFVMHFIYCNDEPWLWLEGFLVPAQMNSVSHDWITVSAFTLTQPLCRWLILWCLLSQDDKKLEDDSVNKRRRKGNHYLSEVCPTAGLKCKTVKYKCPVSFTVNSCLMSHLPCFLSPGLASVVLSQCTTCWRGWGAAGEQGPLHGNSAAGQVRRELLHGTDAQQGERRTATREWVKAKFKFYDRFRSACVTIV